LITKITDFGAFMEIEEGVEGLIYVSELSEARVDKPADAVKLGEKVRTEILSIEPKERRISLSIKQLGRSEERASYESYVGDKNKGRGTSMGDLLGDKLKGALKKEDE
jgi:small subunit ribosomal protein S1